MKRKHIKAWGRGGNAKPKLWLQRFASKDPTAVEGILRGGWELYKLQVLEE